MIYPDGVFRLEMTHSLLTQGTVMTTHGPIKYAPLQSVLMIPSYALGYWVGMVVGVSPEKMTWFGIVTNHILFLPVIISTLCVLYYRILEKMGIDASTGIISTMILFCGTFFLPYAGGLYSEPLNALLILISFYYFYVAPTTDYISCNRKNFFCLGLLVLNNFVFLPYLGLMMAYVFWNSWVKRNNRSEAWRMVMEGSLILGASVVLYLYYNYSRYGQFLNFGYEGLGFTSNWLVGMYGLMFSFGRGLLIYSPLTIFCILYFVFKNHEMESWQKYVFCTTLISFFGYMSIYAKWDDWHGGICWGPRFLLPFVPLIHLMFPWMWRNLVSTNKVLQGGVLSLMVWAVGMNFLYYMSPSAIFIEGDPAVIAKTYERILFIPEESVIFKIWREGNVIPNLIFFLGVLGLCVLLLWFWKKGLPVKLTVSQPSANEAS